MIMQHAHWLSLIWYPLALLVLLGGCMESRVTSPDETPGSQFRGTVRLLSEDNSFSINKNLVLVTLEGTGFETLTDTAGKWTLNLVPKGTYTISYSKPGYSIAKRYAVRSDGIFPVIVTPMTLVERPSYTVDSMFVNIENDSIYFTCLISESSQFARRVIIYVDSLPINIQLRNQYAFTDLTMIIPPGSTKGSISMPLSRYINAGLESGMLIHCAALSIIRFEATADESYFTLDPITKKTVFWNISLKGAIASFTMP